MTDLIAEPARTIHSGVLIESGWVEPFSEIKKVAQLAAKYNVDIYQPRSEYNPYGKLAVLLRDLDAFKALAPDGTSRADYCIAFFPEEDETTGTNIYCLQKISGGVMFWFKLPETLPDFEQLEAELTAYLEDWDSKH